jgi:protocatechuate 3,4-dioxygenase beta subunit
VALFPFDQMQDFGRRMQYVATDARGEVRFRSLADDDWAIDVDRLGVGGVVHSRAGTTTEREVTLTAGVRVEGHVVDRRGAPVAGASLVLHGSRASTTTVATTDADGAFAIEHLGAGIELQARLPGREPSLAHAVRGAAGGSQTLQLVVGDAARTLRGRVLDPDGREVADAVVAILPADARTAQVVDRAQPQVRATWLRTAADGSFACDEIGPGEQIVFARKLPFAPAWVEVDATHATAEVRLRAGATLRGSVTRGNAPVAGVNVLAWATDSAPIGYLQNLFGMRHAVTGADGSYRIDGLLPGEQTVSLMQQTSTLRRATLTLDEGTTHTWHADLAAGHSLKIVLRGQRPPTDARVVAMVRNQPLRDGEAPSIVPIQADGTGELELVRDGNVDVILATLPGGMSLVQFAMVAGVPTNQQEVVFELRADQIPQRRIIGRLVDPRRAPVAGATVTASRVDADGLVVRLDATTASDGTFALGPLPGGDYRLYAGPARAPVAIGDATLTPDRDEQVGDLVATDR